MRRAPQWSDAQVRQLLAAYLDQPADSALVDSLAATPDGAAQPQGEPLMRLSELKSAGRTPSLPLTLDLADAAGPGQLQLLSLLRVLPGQRYVGAGVWRGRPVLAKLLVGSKAARHFQRELNGVRLLAEQGLTTPLLLADGLQEGEGGWLLFEFIEGAESLADAWQRSKACRRWPTSKPPCSPKRWARLPRCTPKACGRKTCTWTTCCARTASCT